ncbi:hypothetical protein [Pedobacter agri]|uniref:ApeA N-terminal domain-containing protein n=1 Tax=Pedobacter agri TaxID=454586 RepID=A0A9X3DAR1_9SPHI|nr:hypothetical protein [Pedobacter agri]MCX3263716.1 hypothetical protein [Pedobacter agri]
MPKWFFRENSRLVLATLKEKITTMLRPGAAQGLPLQTVEPGKLLDGAPEKFLNPTLSAIADFNALSRFEVTFHYLSDGRAKSASYPVYLRHNPARGFSFNIILEELPGVGGVNYPSSYGLHRSLYLKNRGMTLNVPENSVTDFHTRFPHIPQQLTGSFTELKTLDEQDYNGKFQRLILTFQDTDTNEVFSVVRSSGQLVCDRESFNEHDSLMGLRFRLGTAYRRIEIEKKQYHFCSPDGRHFVLDSLQHQDHESFRKHTGVIRMALGVLSGRYYADEAYYLISGDADFKSVCGIWYVLENQTVMSSRRVIDSITYQQHHDSSLEPDPEQTNYRAAMSIEVFEKLCMLMLNHDQVLRTAELVIRAMNNPDPVQQGVLYSAALETLTGSLSEINEDRLNPVPDKEVFTKLRVELEHTLQAFQGEIPGEGKTILRNKISNLNSPTNRDKLVKTFGLYSISLSALQIKTIDHRNKFLHGNSPLDRTFKVELTRISLILHNLIVKLLVKYAGYSGHFINLANLEFLSDERNALELAKKLQKFLNLFREVKDMEAGRGMKGRKRSGQNLKSYGRK